MRKSTSKYLKEVSERDKRRGGRAPGCNREWRGEVLLLLYTSRRYGVGKNEREGGKERWGVLGYLLTSGEERGGDVVARYI